MRHILYVGSITVPGDKADLVGILQRSRVYFASLIATPEVRSGTPIVLARPLMSSGVAR